MVVMMVSLVLVIITMATVWLWWSQLWDGDDCTDYGGYGSNGYDDGGVVGDDKYGDMTPGFITTISP